MQGENCCPRTLVVEEVIREHSNLTVHAVADWLEKIFSSAEDLPDNLPELRIEGWKNLRDFD